MSGYSDFSEIKANVASAEFVLDDGTTYGPCASAGEDLFGSWTGGWKGGFNNADWAVLNGLNADIDVFLNWNDGTRLRFRAYASQGSSGVESSIDSWIVQNELTARAAPSVTQHLIGAPKHPFHSHARTTLLLKNPGNYQAPLPPPPPAVEYSDFSEIKATVATAEIVLDDGTSYGPYTSAGTDTYVYVFHGWMAAFENDAEWEVLNGLNTDVDVFLNWSDGTRLKFRAYSCATSQSADFVEPNELTARAEPNYTQLVQGAPKHPMHATARTSITIREPDYYQAPPLLPADTEKPVITLTGNATITLTQGNTYTEQGAIWVDNKDGTGDATVSGSVDTSAVGTYTISYDYTDAAGNVATTVTRSINVELPWPPTLSAYSELTGFSVSDVTITTASSGSWSGAWSNLPSRGHVGFSAPSTSYPDGSWGMRIRGDATGYTGSGTNHKAITSSNQAGYIQLNSSTGDSLIYEVDLNDSQEDGISQVYSGGSSPTGTENYLGVIIVPTSVPDTEKPVITLTGNATITLTQGNTYTEQGATWVDNLDGTGDANVSGSVDASTIGSYTISYNYTDAAGNVATTVTRTINVVEVPDTEKPVITLTGDAEILVIQGSTYTEQGAIWVDNKDGTGSATVSGSVDTSAVGTYTISYDYTDAAGNVATTVTRTVNVGAPPAAFSVPDLIVNENTAVNHEVSPSGGDWTTTVTNLMSPLTLSGNYIVGTTQEVPGYKNVTVSVAQTATVTRTNSYGSTSAQLDILVLNTTEEPDRDGDGTPDSTDDFPDDPDEDTDTDGDGVGDNKDSHPDDPRFNDVDTNSILYAVGQAVKAAGQSGGGGDTEADSYTTNAFTNGVLSGQSKYTAQGGTLLETKTFTYTSGNLTSVVEKDGSDVITLTKTLTYDGDGNLASITKDYA